MMSKNYNVFGVMPSSGYIREKVLLQIIPFSKATLWRKVKSGQFPKQIKLSVRVSGWRTEDVKAWMEARNTETLPHPKIQKRPITPMHLRTAVKND